MVVVDVVVAVDSNVAVVVEVVVDDASAELKDDSWE